ncbi:MAG: beta-N-acetylhexosaminidase, partial [Betaproteobacteria bacterium TMED156]
MNLGPLIVDISGTSLTKEDKEIILHPLVGGLILFSRNYTSKKQLRNLITKIKNLRKDPSVLICVDQEGGRVQRFRKNFSELPCMREYGKSWNIKNSLSVALSLLNSYNNGKLIASELIDVGVDFSFTPVLDLDWNKSSVIGDRSISQDPYIVFSIANSLMSGLLSAGMKNCAKHFPGHGWAREDSHFSLPMDLRKFSTLKKNDLIPYKLLVKTGILTAVMPAHVVYKKIDINPAGYSSIWLKNILRTQLGFRGLIISDDLSMKGACNYSDILDRVDVSFNAGCDALLICNDRNAVLRVLDDYPKTFKKIKH